MLLRGKARIEGEPAFRPCCGFKNKDLACKYGARRLRRHFVSLHSETKIRTSAAAMSPAVQKFIAGKPVGSVGYGMMSEFVGMVLVVLDVPRRLTFLQDLTLFGTISNDDGIKPMKTALDNGANFWNGVRSPRIIISHRRQHTDPSRPRGCSTALPTPI